MSGTSETTEPAPRRLPDVDHGRRRRSLHDERIRRVTGTRRVERGRGTGLLRLRPKRSNRYIDSSPEFSPTHERWEWPDAIHPIWEACSSGSGTSAGPTGRDPENSAAGCCRSWQTAQSWSAACSSCQTAAVDVAPTSAIARMAIQPRHMAPTSKATSCEPRVHGSSLLSLLQKSVIGRVFFAGSRRRGTVSGRDVASEGWR